MSKIKYKLEDKKGGRGQLHLGDSLEVLKELPDNSIDSLVCDPPAGISFMGMKKWDSDKGGRDHWIAWLAEIMREVHRVLKPGGHGLVWSLPRTSHWTAMALENAGFELRDKISHVFGSGFPKNHNISKGIDKSFGAKREVVGIKKIAYPDSDRWGEYKEGSMNKSFSDPNPMNRAEGNKGKTTKERLLITAPATEEAKQWDGWGSSLKPAYELWHLIRKPLSKGNTIAANVLKWETGGINIDGCRIASDHDNHDLKVTQGADPDEDYKYGRLRKESTTFKPSSGRFPANLLLTHHPDCELVGRKRVKGDGHYGGKQKRESKGSEDYYHYSESGFKTKDPGVKKSDGKETVDDYRCHESCPIKILGDQSGVSKSGTGAIRKTAKGLLGLGGDGKANVEHKDKGTAARFFKNFEPEYDAPFYYCAKPAKKEKNMGLEDREETNVNDGRKTSIDNPYQRGDTQRKNTHPTVKSVKLMRYLCRLITPPGGTVLDCFLGSGTTGIAAHKEGFNFVGIEQSEEYLEIAQRRIQYHLDNPDALNGKKKTKKKSKKKKVKKDDVKISHKEEREEIVEDENQLKLF